MGACQLIRRIVTGTIAIVFNTKLEREPVIVEIPSNRKELDLKSTLIREEFRKMGVETLADLRDNRTYVCSSLVPH